MDALVGLAALSRDVDVQQLGPGRRGLRLTSEWRLCDERGGRRAPASAGGVPAVNPFRTGSQGGPRQNDQAQCFALFL